MIYRDTTGRFDGLDHDGQAFVGFYSIGVTDEAEAIARADLGRLR